MSHAIHPDVHEHGLADDCQDCAHLAKRPMQADDAMIQQFVGAALQRPRVIPEGYNQATAVASVLTTLERVGRMCEAAPALVERYLRESWRLDVRVGGRL